MTHETIKNDQQAVLVVEDDELVLKTTARMIERMGFNVHTAMNAKEAQRILDQHENVCMAVIDLLLPDTDGITLGATIRTNQPDTRLLFISGYPDEILEERGIVAAEMPILNKPYTLNELVKMVKETLNLPD